jgi:hypothetical protein
VFLPLQFFIPGICFANHKTTKRGEKMADAKKFSEMMSRTWPYPFVLRKDVESASGGAFGADYLRTLDHRGQGPKGRFRIGNCVAYPKDAFYAWFAEKMS